MEISRIETQAALVPGVRQPRGEAEAERGLRGPLSADPDLGGDDDVFHVVRGIAGDHQLIGERRRADPEVGDRQPVVETTVDLELSDGTEPDADAKCGHPKQIALQA